MIELKLLELRGQWKDAATCPCDSCLIEQWPCRLLANGFRLHIVPMLFNFRLSLSSPRDAAVDMASDAWCYDRSKLAEVIQAFLSWDGHGDPPGPWKKQVTSGRRGPGADPDPWAVEDL